MCAMQGPTGEDERYPTEMAGEDQNLVHDIIIWYVRLAVLLYLGSLLVWVWGDIGVRLYTLHSLTRALQGAARLLGGWALTTEKVYYELVGSLH